MVTVALVPPLEPPTSETLRIVVERRQRRWRCFLDSISTDCSSVHSSFSPPSSFPYSRLHNVDSVAAVSPKRYLASAHRSKSPPQVRPHRFTFG
ncbi:unnamed protein product [Nippostrongylus brasiliensis]|uniref:Uncharacterized protein n=1 Tax=Nippostrongylus brasiliensis TaxID=27835 RepID=A0A0N4Y3A7_NIPBR|nr:unnamed protein product [Nippostrongylus brasiliensis]